VSPTVAITRSHSSSLISPSLITSSKVLELEVLPLMLGLIFLFRISALSGSSFSDGVLLHDLSDALPTFELGVGRVDSGSAACAVSIHPVELVPIGKRYQSFSQLPEQFEDDGKQNDEYRLYREEFVSMTPKEKGELPHREDVHRHQLLPP
jgi:hypothetical protein